MRRNAGNIRSVRDGGPGTVPARIVVLTRAVAATILACLVFAGMARAQTQGGSPGAALTHAADLSSDPVSLGTGGIVLKLALSLAAVVVLILVLQRVARRYGGALGGGAGSDRIRVISQRAVGPKLSLVLVQVMDRTLLVGVSPQGIRQVADFGAAGPQGAPAAATAPPAPTVAPPLATAARAQGAADFEGELARRLAALRDSYPSIRDLETQAEGGRA